ncbi:hypothetical protein KIN20_025300 [Parelaphostrongylus tenuis]|uniref:Uncharacterized protein n=1 Tax=Parelaphostrongylus tenuis TaxID=148309 RepID=A0AAD5MY91_PARTN|nr:hypothetical protein KIN20_025300 [Parelaphostrongylus tenuis]
MKTVRAWHIAIKVERRRWIFRLQSNSEASLGTFTGNDSMPLTRMTEVMISAHRSFGAMFCIHYPPRFTDLLVGSTAT